MKKELLEKYRNEMKKNGKSEKTINAYIFNVSKFIEWTEKSSGIEFDGKISSMEINAYTSYLTTVKKAALSTINARLSAIQSFCDFLHYNYGMDSIKVQKKKGKVTPKVEILNKQELFQFLKFTETASLLHKTIIYTFLNTGMREEEVCNLELDDIINLDSTKCSYIIIRNGKGGKYREIDIKGDYKKLLREYLAHRPNTDSNKVFIGERGALTPNGVYKLVHRLGEKIGLNVYPHMLRHQFLTQLSKNCTTAQDLKDLSEIAGHSCIETTMKYYISGSSENKKRLTSELNYFAD